MTTSYEELTPESREQVDAFMDNIGERMWTAHAASIQEHVSNLVQTCIYIEKKHDNHAVILTQREWKSLSRGFLNLYNILNTFPTYLGDYFLDSPGEYREIVKWEERFDEEKRDR